MQAPLNRTCFMQFIIFLSMLFLRTTLSKQVSYKTVQFVNHAFIQFCQREGFLAFCVENAFSAINGSHLFFDETITSFLCRVVDIRRFRPLGDISVTMT